MSDKKTIDKLSNNSPDLSNGLSDSEIIKAFECCYLDKPCEECPLYEIKHSEKLCFNGDNYAIPKMVLDIISRLQRENSKLTSDLTSAKAEIKKLKAVLPEKSGVFTVMENAVVYTKSTEDYELFLSKMFKTANEALIEKVNSIICENTYPDFDKDGKPVNIWKAETGYAVIDNLLKLQNQ